MSTIRKSKEDWLRDGNQYPAQCFIGRDDTEAGDLEILSLAEAQALLGVGAATWGSITGTLSNQTDLQSALDLKLNIADFTSTANTWLGTKSTSNLAEGSNLYFTDERAQDAVGGILVASSEIDFTYIDGAPSISASIVLGSIDETKLDTSVNASLDLADSSAQPGDNISIFTNDAGYITGNQTITLSGDITGSGSTAITTAIASGVIINDDINASAAIAHSKMAALTASRAMATDVSGFASASSVTSTELGHLSGVTSAIQTQLNNKQPLDSTLTALAAYNTNGLLTQTAADTFTGRTITGPAAGISVSNGNGVSGNPTLALANDLSALEGLGSTGIAVRSATDTWVQRSVAVTASTGLSVSNGNGVSGDPTLAGIDATTSIKGVASFSSTYFSVSAGVVSLTTSTHFFPKSVERPLNQLYLVALEIPFGCTITAIDHVTRSGSITATYYIGSTAYTQGTAITSGSGSVTSTQATLTPSGANTVSAGQHLQVVFSSNSLAKGLEITAKYTRTIS